jgi:RHS repeat-associated protein
LYTANSHAAGAVYTYEYYAGTTATETTAGGAKYYLKDSSVKNGSSGASVLLEALTYYARTAGGVTVYYVASDTVYEDGTASTAETTTYAYTWFAGAARAETVTQTLPTGAATEVEYDINGQVIQKTNALGVKTVYTYDTLGNTTKVVENYVDGVYSSSHTDEDLSTTYVYDALNRIIQATDAAGNVTFYVYNDSERETRVYTGWRLNTSTGLYYASTNAAVIVYREDLLGNYTETLTYAWTGTGSNALPTNADGSPTGTESLTSSYVSLQTLTRSLMNSAEQIVAVLKYFNLSGLAYSTSRSLGTKDVNYYETDYTYGTWDDLWSVTNAAGNTTSYTYDANGNVTSTTDALGNTTTYEYDGDGRQISKTDALGVKTVYEYNYLGQLVEVCQNYQNGVHSSTDDSDEDVITTYTYDTLGDRLSVTDANGNTTSYTYDALGNVLTETNELGATRYYVYNAVGELVQTTDRDGLVTTYAYDALGRETAENWLDGSGNVTATTSYTYDAVGDMLTASDSEASYTYTYDALGRVLTKTEVFADLSATVVFSYAYNSVGECTQESETVGGVADAVTTYAYDALGRVTSMCQCGVTNGNAVAEKRVDYTYDLDGRYATITIYADLSDTELVSLATYTYNAVGELTSLVYTKGNTTLASYAYTYDAVGDMLSMTTVDGTTYYTYDATGQLLSSGSVSYTYDSTGNRTTANGSTYTTGANNELLDDGTYTYTYDAEGNRLTRINKTTGEEMNYAWDYRNRLISVTSKDGSGNVTQTVTYEYDAFNRLIGETVAVTGGTTQHIVFVYDGDEVVMQFDETSATGSASALSASNLSHRYLWNSQAVDQLFADENVADEEVLYALTDHENSVRDLVTYDAATDVTTVANHKIFDAYGNLTSQTNSAVDCLFGWTGRYKDSATGLQYNLNRWYDAETGGWISQDPLSFSAGDANLYRYVGNSPTNSIDPSGYAQVGDPEAPVQTPPITRLPPVTKQGQPGSGSIIIGHGPTGGYVSGNYNLPGGGSIGGGYGQRRGYGSGNYNLPGGGYINGGYGSGGPYGGAFAPFPQGYIGGGYGPGGPYGGGFFRFPRGGHFGGYYGPGGHWYIGGFKQF